MNYTNPGAISHNEIMELYKSYVDPSLTWANFSIEEQAKVIVAPRSNNLMDTGRIESEFPAILPIRESLIKHGFEPAAAEKGEEAPRRQRRMPAAAVAVKFEAQRKTLAAAAAAAAAELEPELAAAAAAAGSSE